jgi:serine protease Do
MAGLRRLCCAAFAVLPAFSAAANDLAALPNTIEKINPAIVAVGTYQKSRRLSALFRGTRFVIADGLHIVTNAHVLPEKIDIERTETLASRAGRANAIDMREATKVAEDPTYDIAILRTTGRPLFALTLGDSKQVREGETYAFTGFSIGMVLGLNAVTHRGIISAIAPIVIPQLSARQLEKKILNRLAAP